MSSATELVTADVGPATEERVLRDLLGDLKITGGSSVQKGEHDQGSWPAPPNPKFEDELQKISAFRIFQCETDLGFFKWVPRGSYKSMSSIHSKDEIIRQIDLEGVPDNLMPDMSVLQFPYKFGSLPPQEHINKYPFGQFDVGCFYVAKQRGIRVCEEIDFAFGGSTLEMLAKQDTINPYHATLVPGTKCILVVKRQEYLQNYADFGFQFERLVTGKPVDETVTLEYVEHMQIMKVGNYRVLFRAEVDALDQERSPVEIKASNPRYWGTKTMLQMISSGSPTLVQGMKTKDKSLQSVMVKSLSEVSQKALSPYNGSASKLEDNIITYGMDCLKSEMKKYGEGMVLKISFVDGKLKLTPLDPLKSSNALLPAPSIVKALVAPDDAGSVGNSTLRNDDKILWYSTVKNVLLEATEYDNETYKSLTGQEKSYVKSLFKQKQANKGTSAPGKFPHSNTREDRKDTRAGKKYSGITNLFDKPKDENSWIRDGVDADGNKTGKTEWYCSQCPGKDPSSEKGRWTLSHGDHHPTEKHIFRAKAHHHQKGRQRGRHTRKDGQQKDNKQVVASTVAG